MLKHLDMCKAAVILYFTNANEQPMTIKILHIDFQEGTRRHCDTCPVARGCLRAARPLGYVRAAVYPKMVVFRKPGGKGVRRELPLTARVAIKDFDKGCGVLGAPG